jgi:multidrug resistance efflux pump
MVKKARGVLVLAAAVTVAVLLVLLKPEAERTVPEDLGRLVEVLEAHAETVVMSVEAYGTVKPRAALSLVAEVRGQVVALHPSFVEGGHFALGAVLVAIDPRSYELEVERRRAQLLQSQAELKRLEQEVVNLHATRRIAAADLALATEDRDRTRQLFAKHVVSQSTRDKAEQKHLVSLERIQGIDNQIALTGPLRAQMNALIDNARVTLRQAALDLERTRIVAPYAGVVLSKSVEEGQHVAVGQSMGQVYAADALDVDIQVPPKDLQWLPADLGAIDVEISVQGQSQPLRGRGRVARVKGRMEEATRTLPLVIEIDKPPTPGGEGGLLMMRPGMFVTVTLTGRPVPGAFRLPRHVVHPGGLLYTVVENRLKVTPVRVLRAHQDWVVVDSGLKEGDRVVRTPLAAPVEGMKVRVKALP